MFAVFATITVICVFLQLYQYLVYPALLVLLAAVRGGRKVPASVPDAKTTMIICAHNEAGVIGQKIENSLALDPLPDEIIVVDDGSDDGTPDIVAGFTDTTVPVRLITGFPRGGKSAAMNRGAAAAAHEILVFSDATEMYETSAVRHLVAEFSDPSVAVASGAHRIKPISRDEGAGLTGKSEGLYWRYEEKIRKSESDLGATVASVGAILAIRRDDWRDLPPGTINDDAWITMSNLARGRNVRYADKAVSWEEANVSTDQEATRRRRISAGRLLLITQKDVWPLSRPWVLAAFLSHKVLRLALPLLLIAGAVSNLIAVALRPSAGFFVLLLAGHILAFGLAYMGYYAEQHQRRWRLPHLAYHILRANFAGLQAYADLLRRRSFLKWEKPSR
ncbi:glycosyltransferase [Sinisalibacter aestuarii]|uniref:Glycosyltransferase 2-like domain-containing protein n=1 Tax=Sinisalibacter aestuarii TaxID=2949426 RepID=A0ABQ5LTR9_9RHOB|nr:glycosyltransferase [Sinisalibacter aestuarii]GKY88153.1 hypothetical protein STA1M1_20220 [Sinisalibacter aestuarii]